MFVSSCLVSSYLVSSCPLLHEQLRNNFKVELRWLPLTESTQIFFCDSVCVSSTRVTTCHVPHVHVGTCTSVWRDQNFGQWQFQVFIYDSLFAWWGDRDRDQSYQSSRDQIGTYDKYLTGNISGGQYVIKTLLTRVIWIFIYVYILRTLIILVLCGILWCSLVSFILSCSVV